MIEALRRVLFATDANLADVATQRQSLLPKLPMAKAVDQSALAAEAKNREAEAKIQEAEQRAREAEAAMRLQEAEMKARAAEQALAQQARMAALEKALRDAMPGWFGTWTDQSTEALQHGR